MTNKSNQRAFLLGIYSSLSKEDRKRVDEMIKGKSNKNEHESLKRIAAALSEK